MSPGKTKAKATNRTGGKGGSRKTAKKAVAARAKEPAPGADGVEVTPYEESDGFQIFKVAKAGAKKKAAAAPRPPTDSPAAGDVAEDAPAPPPGAPAEAPVAAPFTAPNGAPAGDAVGRWMAETIGTIVREEMRLAVARITRSVIDETGAGGPPGGSPGG